MTNQAMVPSAHAGMQEIKAVYKKNLLKALIIAVSLHLLLIGIYYGRNIFSQDDEHIMTVRIMKYTDLGPPPSITNTEAAPQVASPIMWTEVKLRPRNIGP